MLWDLTPGCCEVSQSFHFPLLGMHEAPQSISTLSGLPFLILGFPPRTVIRLEQLLSCCKLLLFTFAPERIFHPWLDGAVHVRPLTVLLGG